LSGFTYVFSTGDIIDSLTLSGTVVDAETQSVAESGWLSLYANLSDSAFQTQRPLYISKTNRSGQFRFTHLGEGTYNLFALTDNNFNFIYDLPNEHLAFLSNPTVLPETEQSIVLQLFESQETAAYVDEFSAVSPTHFRLAGRGEIAALHFSSPTLDWDKMIRTISEQGDTIDFWLPTPLSEDSLLLFVKDTISLYADTLKLINLPKFNADTLFLITTPIQGQHFLIDDVSIHTPSPLDIADSLAVQLLEDSLFVAGGGTLISDKKLPTRHVIEYPWRYGSQYTLSIPANRISDIYGRANDSLVFSFTIPLEESLATLLLTLLNGKFSTTYILQLLQSDRLVYTFPIAEANADPILLKNLTPGTYNIRVIIDENSNGYWDSGNYEMREQPEKVIVFPETIRLRQNWELALQIDVAT